MRSGGRDGVAQGEVDEHGLFAVADLGADTVFADGVFARRADALTSVVHRDDFASADARFWSAAEP